MRRDQLAVAALAGVMLTGLVAVPVGAQESPAACLDAASGPATPQEPTPGVEPGELVVTSDDGLLRLDIPAGALPAGTVVSATYQDPACAAPELAGVSFRTGFYALRPTGTAFATPVRVTRTVSMEQLGLDPMADGMPLIGLASRSADGSWGWLDGLRVDLDGETDALTVSGSLSGFTDLYGIAPGERLLVDLVPADLVVEVGSASTVTLTLTSPDAATASIGGDAPLAVAADIDAPDGEAAITGYEPYNMDASVVEVRDDTLTGNVLSGQYTCLTEGASRVGFDLSVADLGAGSTLLPELGLEPYRVESYVGAIQTCSKARAVADGVSIERVCARVIHKRLRRFISYLLFYTEWGDTPVRKVEFTVKDANGGNPVKVNVRDGISIARLGLSGVGDKTIEQVIAVTDAGRIDVTSLFLDALPAVLAVTYPEQAKWGRCAGVRIE